MENITLNRDLVLGFRKKGLTYYEIAEKFVSPDADAKLKKKQTDQLMCMDGGIIDICENPDGNPERLILQSKNRTARCCPVLVCIQCGLQAFC